MGRGLSAKFRHKEVHIAASVSNQFSETDSGDSWQAASSVISNKSLGHAEFGCDLAGIQQTLPLAEGLK
jgi:hypothetical protein